MSTKVAGDSNASFKAAVHVKRKYAIPDNVSLISKFEEEFNCQCQFFPGDDETDPWLVPLQLEFGNEHDACLFLLRWS